MKTKNGDFIEIEYTARIKESNLVFDTTDEKIAKENHLHGKDASYKPVIICLGNKELIKGLDDFLVDKEDNNEYEIDIKAKDAFGEKDPKLLQLVNTSKFLKQNVKPYPGLQINIDNIFGTVKTVSGGRTLVDFNHPLAGKDVIYKVKINKIVVDANEKIKSHLSKMLGGEVDFKYENSKLTIELNVPNEMQKVISDELKNAISEIKEVEFKKKEIQKEQNGN